MFFVKLGPLPPVFPSPGGKKIAPHPPFDPLEPLLISLTALEELTETSAGGTGVIPAHEKKVDSHTF